MTRSVQSNCSACIDLVDEKLCYAILPPLDDKSLEELLKQDAVVLPTRLVASPLHAAQCVKLANRAWKRGYSRARKLPVEVLLYALAARGDIDPTRVELRTVASEGPKPGEHLVAVCRDESLCNSLVAKYGCAKLDEVKWLGVPEDLALARSALAAAEVERKRLLHGETA
ncbi:protein of unknown function DUF509 [Pyrolobus fumarii 1A]|uniref:Uncharacterized protein n=1 Tax=Pyrolobus fumarii (strain DSM 11204 / 1A) TaxID=694429 RepID=G0ECP4_PYRF1|nr:hypothetical protein [Pyrolobus fumarii]AEM39614.1 protein of unknown function DUF509 [Pyrolobus fumarii 1A]